MANLGTLTGGPLLHLDQRGNLSGRGLKPFVRELPGGWISHAARALLGYSDAGLGK
jgi:hypothetical protein